MRSHALVLLSTALLACIAGVSTTNPFKVTVTETRFLRKSDPKTNEERVIGGSLTSKVGDFIGSAKLQKYKLRWKTLQLDDDLSKVLKSPQVEKIAKYNLNKASGSQVSMFRRITAKYSDDILARTLVSIERGADDNPALLAMVKQLRDDQIANWLKNGETVPGVISKLKLGTDESIFRSKALDVLEDFIKKYNTARNGDESLLKTLTTIYGGESELVKMIAKARIAGSPPYGNNPASIKKADDIENQLIGKWKSENRPDFSVMSKLKFDDDINKALNSGKVRVLLKYSNSKTSAFKRLSAKYGEAEVAIAFAKAKRGPFYNDVATVLYQRQMNGWLSNGDTAERVFSILKFKEPNNFVFKLDALEEYVKLLKTKNPDDVTDVFKVLKQGFGADEDKLAIAIVKPYASEITGYHKSLFNDWMARDLDPMSVAVNVFKISETSAVSGFSKEVAPIMKQYTKFYNGAADIQPLPPAVRNGRS
ncbi:hypothetical protein DVH05_004802 [Phytophthora capsici]|nr:hypothetical protein DVH05_004802 [Phytophthora capsici]